MTGYRVVNLGAMIEELGEDAVKRILSDFSCPLNPDVEFFLSKKAIDFAKQRWAQTHLVFASYKDEWGISHLRISIFEFRRSTLARLPVR